MNTYNIDILSTSVRTSIKSFLELKKEENFLMGVNQVLRDDIFELLKNKCLVIFYPLPDEEENDGFHITLPLENENKNFVFINTTKYTEKQVFTAAHELGHILKIEKYLKDKCKDYNDTLAEFAVNHFATLLLVPDDVFKKIVNNFLNDLIAKNLIKEEKDCYSIRDIDFYRLVAHLMNFFLVPYKTIVYRLYECSFINKDIVQKVIEQDESDYPKILIDCIEESKFKKLHTTQKIKEFADLPQLLEEVEKKKIFTQEKINNIRKTFDIKPVESNKDKDLSVCVGEEKNAR